MNNNNGFTLVEIIVSLVIAGIMAAVAGMGIVSMVQGYDFARENVVISQKAQLVMARLRCELMNLSYIDSTNSTGSCIIYEVETEPQPYRVIRLDSDNLKLRISQVDDCTCSSSGDTLSDKVGSFDILYQKEDGSPLTPPFDPLALRSIHVSFKLDRNDGNNANDFEITINPRNNGNLNAPGF